MKYPQMFFVKCKGKDGETVLLNADRIKLIRRHYREERADVIEDADGNLYECFHSENACPGIMDCLIPLAPLGTDYFMEYWRE